MFIILLFFALIRTLHGVPLSSPFDASDGIAVLDRRNTQDHLGQRTVDDIVISCFATITACTWSAVHPNIPCPTDCWWTRFKRQVVTMVYALLAPEAITAWALRQNLAARKIVDKYNRELEKHNADINESTRATRSLIGTLRNLFQDSPLPPAFEDGKGPRWTLAHGFFLQMGGFMLCENGRPIQTLGDSVWADEDTNIIWNIQNGIIDPPGTSEEDIQDRSKGDTISKTLIILQTTWFIAQCVARWTNQLPVMELEVVTLGFAMLNGMTYWLWWNKPQNVGRPVYLEIKRPQHLEKVPFAARSPRSNQEKEPRTSNVPRKANMEMESMTVQLGAAGEKGWLRRKLHQEFEENNSHWQLLWRVSFRLLMTLIRPLSKVADYTMQCVRQGDLRVTMFYSAEAKNSEVYTATTAIGVAFGSLHLIASWAVEFASLQELWLWRVSAFIITIAPIFLGLWQYFRRSSLGSAFGTVLIIGLPFYIVSRIILLMLSLISLRALPPLALQTIEWITFIPHL